MIISMVYFSGTGNTERITQELGALFSRSGHEVKLIAVETVVHDNAVITELSESDLIGIGYPVYDLREPKIISDFIDMLPVQETEVPVFQYSTLALIKGDCHSYVTRKLGSGNYYVIADTGFKCPSNGVVTYEAPDHWRQKKVGYAKNIGLQLNDFRTKVLESYEKFITAPYSVHAYIFPVFDIFRFFSRRLFGDRFYRDLAVSEKCNACGLCVKSCPDKNLCLKDARVEIKKSNGCLRCLRCVSMCPRQAITFTSSNLKRQYTKEIRDRLFEEAVNPNCVR